MPANATLFAVVLLALAFSVCGCSKSKKTEPAAPARTLAAYVLEVKTFAINVGPQGRSFEENCYLLFDRSSKDGVIVDPGSKSPELESFIDKEQITVRAILNTHGHWDHIGANGHLAKKYEVDVFAHTNDRPLYGQGPTQNTPTKYIDEECELTFGTISLRVIHTPGHSPGSIHFLAGSHLFCGDSLFRESIGRTWASETATAEDLSRLLIESLKKKILVLPDETIVYPGHGESSTIGYEKANNPFVGAGR